MPQPPEVTSITFEYIELDNILAFQYSLQSLLFKPSVSKQTTLVRHSE